ncbi:MAG: hypothetical protein ACK5N8_08275 [Alphaproteobacteria bacterium]
MSDEIQTEYEKAKSEEGLVKNDANDKFMSLDRMEIFVEQEEQDEKNILAIKQAHENGEVDKDTVDYLSDLYNNTMYKYGVIYHALEESLGKPKSIKFKNLKTGELKDIYRKNGKVVDYSKRCITPSTSVQVVFSDKYGNDLFLDLPGIKNTERAIEKVKVGGKYHTAYENDKKKIRVNFASQSEEFAPLIMTFLDKVTQDSAIKKDIGVLNEKYVRAVNYYLTELGKIKFDQENKAKEIEIKKKLYQIASQVKENKSNVPLVLKDLYDTAMEAGKFDKNMLGFFNEKNLLSRYLSDMEDVFKDREEYKKLQNVYYKFLGDNQDYIVKLAKVKKPHERLKDIYRCSITTKYYDNISNLKGLLGKSIKILSGDDKFFGNESPHHEGFKNSKGYRDDKVIYEIEGVPFETQFKLRELSSADYTTHKIYEEERALREELKDCYDPRKVEELKRQIRGKNMDIRDTYDKSLAGYNRKVMETAAERELEIFREEWEEKDRQTIKDRHTLKRFLSEREKAYQEIVGGTKTYPETETFLKDNLLVSPFKALVVKDEIENIKEIEYTNKNDEGSDYLILSDDYASTPDMKSFARRYLNVIEKAYVAKIDGRASDKFFEDYDKADKERQEKTSKITEIRNSLHARSLSSVDVAKIDEEEKIYLAAVGKENVAEKSKTYNNSGKTGRVVPKRNFGGR